MLVFYKATFGVKKSKTLIFSQNKILNHHQYNYSFSINEVFFNGGLACLKKVPNVSLNEKFRLSIFPFEHLLFGLSIVKKAFFVVKVRPTEYFLVKMLAQCS